MLLATLIKQLVQVGSSTAGPVEQLRKQHADRGTKPSLDEIFGTFRVVLTKDSTIYIVVDALDQCRYSDGTRCQLLAKLLDLKA